MIAAILYLPSPRSIILEFCLEIHRSFLVFGIHGLVVQSFTNIVVIILFLLLPLLFHLHHLHHLLLLFLLFLHHLLLLPFFCSSSTSSSPTPPPLPVLPLPHQQQHHHSCSLQVQRPVQAQDPGVGAQAHWNDGDH